ncbi:dTDP-4-dehydrorhamnose 3,5-epimerase [Candidatus Parcubacteria bacterium]|nr:dTDP-4-dehydrorhamnose 3,5-epimerase [Candidatus Parcubacteria bacterium]
MKIRELEIKGVFEIELESKEDERGFFMKTLDEGIFKTHGIARPWIHEYQSLSKKAGTIRGIHFQLPPFSESKLVRVVQGKIMDIFVDLRQSSETFGQYGSAIISAENKKMIYVPRGFGHAVCTLEDNTILICKMDNHYSAESERQIIWNDPDLNISWPHGITPILSNKDSSAKSFKEFVKNHGSI